MPIKSYMVLTVLFYALSSCNDNQQSGFSGERKGTTTNANLNPEDNSEEQDKPNKKGGKSDRDKEIETDDEIEEEEEKNENESDLEKNEDIDTDEASLIAKIPGVKVVRVGVNFEDLGFNSKSDNDYNDAVLCFEGNFKVENTDIVSIKSQTVSGTTFSSSGCNHKIKVEITHADGSKEPNLEYDSRAGAPVTMKFKTGSKMEVFMTPYKGCNEGVKRNMHDVKHAMVKPDVCKNSGG
jgi:hypothetical protein